jgi:peroxiredoxin
MNAINPAEQAEVEAKRYDIEFPVLVCRETGVVRDYQVTKLPQLFIIDRKGIIQESKLFLKMEKIKEEIDTLLAEQKKAELKE